MSCCNNNCNHDPCGSSFNQAVTRAAQYAQYAQTQANLSQEAWKEFNALYLGSFAVAPTADNEGNPLQNGALYWNSASNQLFVWNGTIWVLSDFNQFTNFTSTGTTTARNLVTRFKDVINVKDYGAIGDGVADDTAEIQAAIDANPGKAIYFPAGNYKITSQIRIKRAWTSLIADATGVATLQFATDTTNAAILVRSDLDPAFPSIFSVNILNIRLQKTVTNTVASVGIEFDRADGTRFINSEVVGFATSLKVSGGRNNYFSDLRLSAFGIATPISGTSIVEIKSSTFSGGLTGFTQMFDNCIISADFVIDYAVSILGNDYCSFANSYIASATVAIIRINGNGGSVYDNWFDHCYFDGGKGYADNPSPLCLWIQENSPGTEPNAIQNFTDCIFGQADNAVYIDEDSVTEVGFIGCRFRYCYESGISCDSNNVDLRIVGCTFRDSVYNLPNKSVIALSDVSSAVISGNIFYFQPDKNPYPVGTRAILITASVSADTIAITGNTFTSNHANVIDYERGVGSTIGELTISGNASNNATNTIVGNIIGNVENPNPVSLDWYEEGTFTPTIGFGGASTGVTYNIRTASATRIGNRVLFTIYLELTNKGSSTGILEIGSLPYTVNTVYPSNYTVSCSSLAIGVGDANIDAAPSTNPNKIFVRKQSAGATVNLTDADVTNTTYFNITGTYQVA